MDLLCVDIAPCRERARTHSESIETDKRIHQRILYRGCLCFGAHWEWRVRKILRYYEVWPVLSAMGHRSQASQHSYQQPGILSSGRADIAQFL